MLTHTQQRRTKAFGATVADPVPRAFVSPCPSIASAPLFASCNNPTQKYVADRRVSTTRQFALTRGFARAREGGARSIRRRRNCVRGIGSNRGIYVGIESERGNICREELFYGHSWVTVTPICLFNCPV